MDSEGKPEKRRAALHAELRAILEKLATEEDREAGPWIPQRVLPESDDMMRLLFEYAPDPFYVNDLKGIFLDGNRAAETLVGYSRDELVGKSFLSLNLLPASQLPRAAKNLARNALGLATGPDEFQLRRRNGRIVTVEIRTFPVKAGGRTIVLGIAHDMTDRKRMEHALQESEEKFREMAGLLPQAIYECDLEGNFTYTNKHGLDLMGYSAREVEDDLSVFDILVPEDKPRARETVKSILAGKPLEGHEYTGVRKDGSTFPMLTYSMPILKNGKPAGLRGVAVDLTAQKQSEAALREARDNLERAVAERTRDLQAEVDERRRVDGELQREKAHMEQLFESSQEAIVLGDAEGRIARVNPEFVRLFGFAAHEVRGQLVDDVVAGETERLHAREITRMAGDGVRLEVEAVRRNKEGQPIDVSILTTPIHVGGQPAGVYGIYRDISARKRAERALQESEKFYRSLFESAHDAIIIFRPEDETVLEVNQRACDLYGYGRDEFVGLSLRDISRDPHRGREKVRLILENGYIHGFETVQFRKDGAELHLEVNGSLVAFAGSPAILSIARDISEREETLRALAESEEKFRAVMEQSADSVYLADVETGAVLEANPALQELLGYDRGQMLSMTLFDFVDHPHEDIEAKVEVLKTTGHMDVGERAYRRADGTGVPVEVRAHIIQYGDRKAYCVMAHDLTERKRTTQALLRSEERFRSVYENVALGLYRTTPGGRILMANPALVKLLGYESFRDLATRNLEASGFEPDYDRDAFRERLEREGEVRGLESAWHTKDGRTIHIRESAKVVRDEAGDVKYYEGTVEDITHRKKVEEALRAERDNLLAMLDAMPHGIYIIDPDRTIAFANPALSNAFGPFEGKTCYEYLLDRSAPCEHCYLASVLAGERHRQTWRSEKAGRTYDILSTAIARPEEGPAMMEIFRDITQRLQAEEEKDRIQEQLLQAQKMEAVGILAGGVAHDFNNLLTTILCQTEVTLSELPPESPLAENLQDSIEACNRAAALTEQLLLFSRKQPVKPQNLNPNLVVVNLLKMLDRLIGEDVKIEFDLEPDPWTVHADQGNLEQVVMNLVVNARDAMPAGGTVILRTANVPLVEGFALEGDVVEPGRYVRVSVSDTGMGMDEDTASRIFEPFFTTKGPTRGTGLGLSVVYGIVRRHGGWINVESRQNEGTTFHVHLPALGPEPAKVPTDEMPLESFAGQGEKILLVEDESTLRRMVSTVLRREGYVVLEAESAEDALAMAEARQGDFDIVVSDVVLPDQSGIDLVEILREQYPGMKVLLSSGYADQKSQWNLINERGYPFLEKPFRLPRLFRRIREVLDADPA